MPSPERMNWKAINAEPQVAEAMQRHWPEDLPEGFDVSLFYAMLHMDRLTGRVTGRAEALDVDAGSLTAAAGYSA